MGKLEVKMEPFATQADRDRILADVQSAMSGGREATPAGVELDAEGKVASVFIGTPGDTPAADHLAARDAAINNNVGVATASVFPLGGVLEDFNALTPGDVIHLNTEFSPTKVPISGLIIEIKGSTGRTNVVAAQAADSVGATGSAHELKEIDTVSRVVHSNGATYRVRASDNGLNTTAGIEGFRMSASMKLIDQGDTGDSSTRTWITMPGYPGLDFKLRFDPQLNGTNTWWLEETTNPSNKVDTGIAHFSQVDYVVEYTPEGIYTLTVGAFSITRDYGFAFPRHAIVTNYQIWDFYNVAQVATVRSMILDDMTITLLSGQQA
jgi:hypothetical protein